MDKLEIRATERPILFSTPMVKAILEDRKTMTRRKKGIPALITVNEHTHYEYKGTASGLPATHCFARMYRGNWVETKHAFCPYGQPGDKLWVRETFVPNYFDNHTSGYKADWNSTAAELIPEPKWKPSIHMPKSAARIWLEIVSIRVERLHDITNEDAKCEGVLKIDKNETYFAYDCKAESYPHPKGSFFSLWESINGAESLASNPWLWVIEFKRINH